MADNKQATTKKRRIRKVETVRQKAEVAAKAAPKPRRVKQSLKVAGKPIVAAYNLGKKEYYLPLPDNRFWRFMNKRRHIVPRYFAQSFQELRKVTWPDRKQTTQLTIAVFVFAISFGIVVAITDYGLDRIFKRLLIK
ncbi:MAG: preprotein translocase subunit SecE [Candidatus Saccharimonadales bacterium]